MMHKNEIKLLTESTMLEQEVMGNAKEAAIPDLAQLNNLEKAPAEEYKFAVINLRNTPSLALAVNDPAGFCSTVTKKLLSGAIVHSVSLDDAAKALAIVNAVRAVTSTAEPVTIDQLYRGATLRSDETTKQAFVDYTDYALDLAKGVAQAIERITESFSEAAKSKSQIDKKILVSFGECIAVLYNLSKDY